MESQKIVELTFKCICTVRIIKVIKLEFNKMEKEMNCIVRALESEVWRYNDSFMVIRNIYIGEKP